MSGPDAATEDASKRDGLLSYALEWHALAIGVYHGFKHLDRPTSNPDVEAEPHYYKGGYVTGYLLKAVIVVTMGATAAGVI